MSQVLALEKKAAARGRVGVMSSEGAAARDEALIGKLISELVSPELPVLPSSHGQSCDTHLEAEGDGDGGGDGVGGSGGGEGDGAGLSLGQSKETTLGGRDKTALRLAAHARPMGREAALKSNIGRLEMELAEANVQAVHMRSGLERAKKVRNENAAMRDKASRRRAEISTLRHNLAEAREAGPCTDSLCSLT
jgi:hypothetical protein